ncbi:hypothetical protein ATCC90586_007046 [Pythium insidiosum]|nr:hypothetical protein ATCC90586_007046 [Pythium insidiosum]
MYANQHGNARGPPPPQDDIRRVYEQLARLQREKGEADGMVQILHSKLAEAEETNFDLRANMATIEAEIKFESKKNEEQMQRQVASLESKLSFLHEQLKNAERTKLRALRELEELQQKHVLEQKRLDAEKRLLATKKRKHESALLAASQSLMTRMSQLERPQTPMAVAGAPQIASAWSQATSTSAAGKAPHAGPSVASDAVQTDPPNEKDRVVQENLALLGRLFDTAGRDLLVLFKGSSEAAIPTQSEAQEGDTAADPATAPVDIRASQIGAPSEPSTTIGFSQSVFSQIAGHAQAQVHASLVSFAKEATLTQAVYANERAQDLHDALAEMIHGDSTAMALTPVLIRYLAAPTDLDAVVLSSVLRVLYFVMLYSDPVQQFLLLSSSSASASSSSARSEDTSSRASKASMRHPRISIIADDCEMSDDDSAAMPLRYASLSEYLTSRREDPARVVDATSSPEQLSERMQLRAKLMSALCRVIRNNLNDAAIVENGLGVLELWVDISAAARAMHSPEFRSLVTGNVIQEVVLAPKGVALALKIKTLSLLAQLVPFRDAFVEIDASARRTLLFNRCAKLLMFNASTAATAAAPAAANATSSAPSTPLPVDVRRLQHMVVRVLLAIILAYPSTGVRFVLETTRGQHGDPHDEHSYSVVFYLAELLHHETFEARTLGNDGVERLRADAARLALVQDAFALMALLVRYVDLSVELNGADREWAFQGVLYLLRSGKFDRQGNDTISKTAAAILSLTGAPRA